MDEKETFELVKHAVAVDAIKSAESGRAALADLKPPRRRVRLPWTIGSVAAMAATIAIAVNISRRPPLIEEFRFEAVSLRGQADHRTATVALSRPGHVSIVLVDSRYERWLMPFRGEPVEYARWIDRRESLSIPLDPRAGDARGPARAIYAVLIARRGGQPTPAQILEAIADPMAPADVASSDMAAILREAAVELSRRYDCAVHVEAVP